jgi:hypothetical protein
MKRIILIAIRKDGYSEIGKPSEEKTSEEKLRAIMLKKK